MTDGPALTLTGVLLTGGESRRMGRDKATLVLGGRPLWKRQLALLHEMPVESVWVSARAVPPWCPPDIETVTDAAPSRGPLSGLAATLQRLRTTHLLVLAVDLPRMTSTHLRRLWAEACPGRGVVPLHEGGHEPLCTIYPREAVTAFTAALDGSSAASRPVVAGMVAQGYLRSYPLSPSETRLYENMNTPTELEAARRCCAPDPAPVWRLHPGIGQTVAKHQGGGP